MEGQASHSHRAIFSQHSAPVLPLTSPSTTSFLLLPPTPGWWWSVVHLLCTPAVRCSKDSTQRAACVFQIAGIVLQCLYWWSQANSLICVLSFDQRFRKSRYVRVLSECLCRGVSRWAVLCVQMASSDELLLVSSVQSFSPQFRPSTLDDLNCFSLVL